MNIQKAKEYINKAMDCNQNGLDEATSSLVRNYLLIALAELGFSEETLLDPRD